jgi:hypothetical protein
MNQKQLESVQLQEFYHDLFVDTQLEHFCELCAPLITNRSQYVVDVGGGCGYFAHAVAARFALPSRVIDMDPVSVARCQESGVEAVQGDALQPPVAGDEGVVCFNLILHHLVGDSEASTKLLQAQALDRWRNHAKLLFVNEYIYDSYVGGAAGRLIFAITSNPLLSAVAAMVSKFVPTLRANTFGVGVRFRGESEWRQFFARHGFRVLAHKAGREEDVSLARRLLLIKSCRRDSFVLQADSLSGRLGVESV